MSLFKYDYVDPGQLDDYRLIAEGEGLFKILDIKEAISKSSGNPQLVIGMRLTDSFGKTTLHNEYIPFNKPGKIKDLCDGVGKSYLYNKSGELDLDHLVLQGGKCLIHTEESAGYPAKSKILRYIDPAVELSPALPDDELEF